MQDTHALSGIQARRILISGSSGLIGREIVADRRAAGDVIVPLVRCGDSSGAVQWAPNGEALDPTIVSGFDIVIHLAGEPLGGGRWTEEKKRKIFESRVQGTTKLAAALAVAELPPKVFICASGINFYGDRGETLLDETVSAGNGFLSKVCVAWEKAAAPLAAVSRVVSLRMGVVLAANGGTLKTMLPLFRLGLGGPVAGGHAYVSWISMRDLVRAVAHVIDSEHLRGPLNIVSPEPVTGRVFTAALGKAVGRHAVIPLPKWAARLALGEFADETVLSSVRAIPSRLIEDGFQFQDATISAALGACGLLAQ